MEQPIELANEDLRGDSARRENGAEALDRNRITGRDGLLPGERVERSRARLMVARDTTSR
jgi:hypothetical protein